MPISRRKISFKPESDIKIALIEIEAIAETLGLPITIDDVINAALKSYLPAFLTALRENLSQKEKKILFTALTEAESYLKEGKITPDVTSETADSSEREEAEEAYEVEEAVRQENEFSETPEDVEGETVETDLLKKICF